MSTDNLGRLNTVKLIAVPPLSIKCAARYSCVLKYSNISFNLSTFSNVSRTNPYCAAALPMSALLYFVVLYPPILHA